MISSDARKQLVRQTTCPAVVSGRHTIPFCIPTYKKTDNSTEDEVDGQLTQYSQRRQASSLGALNKDLYIVDQYESQEGKEGSDGFFSSSTPANFPPEHVGRVWFSLTYERETETLVLSLLKARNLKRCDGTKGFTTDSKSCHIPASESEQQVHSRSPSLKIKRKLFAMSRRCTITSRKDGLQDKSKSMDYGKNVSPNSQRKMNSLVNIYLLPDKRIFGQAKCKKGDIDPIFVDRFVFQISPNELKTRSLRMVFVEIDEVKKHHVIGHVTRLLSSFRLHGQLSYEDLERGRPANCKDSIDCADAEILVSLCYDSDMSRLTVILLRMKLCLHSEKNADTEQDIDLKFSVCGKSTKSKKCKTTRRQVDKHTNESNGQTEFAMNESFRFDIKPEEFALASLLISVKSKTGKNETTSCVALGGYMFARGSALEHWAQMTDSPNQFIQSWHHLISQTSDYT